VVFVAARSSSTYGSLISGQHIPQRQGSRSRSWLPTPMRAGANVPSSSHSSSSFHGDSAKQFPFHMFTQFVRRSRSLAYQFPSSAPRRTRLASFLLVPGRGATEEPRHVMTLSTSFNLAAKFCTRSERVKRCNPHQRKSDRHMSVLLHVSNHHPPSSLPIKHLVSSTTSRTSLLTAKSHRLCRQGCMSVKHTVALEICAGPIFFCTWRHASEPSRWDAFLATRTCTLRILNIDANCIDRT
jgi:hypothetical protein